MVVYTDDINNGNKSSNDKNPTKYICLKHFVNILFHNLRSTKPRTEQSLTTIKNLIEIWQLRKF